jgi:hypothetical protein
MSKTVMLIHGAWLTPAAWSLFRARYEARGYESHCAALGGNIKRVASAVGEGSIAIAFVRQVLHE